MIKVWTDGAEAGLLDRYATRGSSFAYLPEVAGVHIHAHRWRHTFATDLLSKGVPVSEVAAILGNSTRIVEKHYAQWIQARQDAIERAVKATWD